MWIKKYCENTCCVVCKHAINIHNLYFLWNELNKSGIHTSFRRTILDKRLKSTHNVVFNHLPEFMKKKKQLKTAARPEFFFSGAK